MSAEDRALVLSVFRERGRVDALDLRGRAAGMDGTAIIAEEEKIPVWDAEKDYTGWVVGAPVAYGGNIFGLLIPHHAAHYPGANPANSPAMWSVKHTKDAARAKEYLAPSGVSGLYMADECCMFGGVVYRSLRDDNAYSPEEYADWWEVVQ